MFGLAADTARVLTFRASARDFAALGRSHLWFGLAWVWLVGVGRYWDNPRVGLLEHAGIGSLVYVFLLTAFLYWMIRPLRPANWSYEALLTFIALTAPPAILYAIPVEAMLPLDQARSINAAFLGIVASWRVALLVGYLRRHGGLGWPEAAVGTALPLCGIVTVLTLLNLDRVVFDLMSGNTDEESGQTVAYGILVMLTVASVWLVAPLAVAWAWLVARARRRSGAAAGAATSSSSPS